MATPLGFRKFSEVWGRAWTCSDLFGCVQIRPDAFGSVRMSSEAFENFRIFVRKLVEAFSVFGSFRSFRDVFRPVWEMTLLRAGANCWKQGWHERDDRDLFQKKSQNVRCLKVFASFRRFGDVFGPVRTHSDAFGCVRMRSEASDAFGSI